MTKVCGKVSVSRVVAYHPKTGCYPTNRYSLKGHTHLATLVGAVVESTDNSTADHTVCMAYLSGNWATECRAIGVAGRLGDRRLISSMFYISRPTDCPVKPSGNTWDVA